MKKEKIKWDLSPHTKIKHFILRKYLDAWLPIISQNHGRVIFIDGFAGPGEYSGGEDGSPIISLKSVVEHKFKMKSEFVFLFVEKEEDRCNHLKELLNNFFFPKDINIKFNVECGEFKDVVGKLLKKIEKKGDTLAPTFLFIDPFGFSRLPIKIIEKFMNNMRCEVLISFMYEDIIRWCGLHQNLESGDILFGTDEWRKIRSDQNLSSEERVYGLHDLYKSQLKKIGIKFVRSFKMVNKHNKTDYFLFFGTNNLRGLEKMKESMWRADPSGKFCFSDSTYDPRQMVLFSSTPNYNKLKKEILSEYKGKEVSIDELEFFVTTKTEFLKTHIRRNILSEMESKNEIEVIRTECRKGTFPNGKTRIRFL